MNRAVEAVEIAEKCCSVEKISRGALTERDAAGATELLLVAEASASDSARMIV